MVFLFQHLVSLLVPKNNSFNFFCDELQIGWPIPVIINIKHLNMLHLKNSFHMKLISYEIYFPSIELIAVLYLYTFNSTKAVPKYIREKVLKKV